MLEFARSPPPPDPAPGLPLPPSFMRRLLLCVSFLALVGLALERHLARLAHASPAGLAAFAAGNPPAEPGSFPDAWIAGLDCDGDPNWQVHAYNDDLFILRQSKCESYEAPFLYLICGEQFILLLDTGANPQTPLAPVVENLIRRWKQQSGHTDAKLVVAHTHGHFDHVQGDAQFVGSTAVPVGVDLNPGAFEPFWGFRDYPNDIVQVDLGNRVLDVIGVPGHHPRSVAVYDRNTQLLLTGDIVYPGHLFVFSASDWPLFVQSIGRLVDFAANHPVSAVVGCHIEFSDTPFQPYQYTTLEHPDEAPLELPVSILADIQAAALSVGPDPECTIFDQFVIHIVYKCGILWNG
jgi:hydroxyacylglutathione hydrolase